MLLKFVGITSLWLLQGKQLFVINQSICLIIFTPHAYDILLDFQEPVEFSNISTVTESVSNLTECLWLGCVLSLNRVDSVHACINTLQIIVKQQQ